MWDLQPTLIGRRVRLEPLAPEHRDALFEVAGPPEIWETGRSTPVPAEAFDAWFDHCLETALQGGDSHFATILQATDEPVGSTAPHCSRGGPRD